jgi:hypothetical protein
VLPRPRQTYNDCVVAVLHEITGEDEATAFARFHPHLTGPAGITLAALSSCLADAGWTLTPYSMHEGTIEYPATKPVSRMAFKQFWKYFQGEAVVFYTRNDMRIGHTVLVRSGGIVFDPHPLAPESGEFFVDHFSRGGGEKIVIDSVSLVTKTSSR